MASQDILGTLDISDYVAGREGFGIAPPEIVDARRLSGFGSKVIKSYSPNVERRLTLRITASSKDLVNSAIRGIQQKLESITEFSPLVYSYTPNGSSYINYTDVLYGHLETVNDLYYEKEHAAIDLILTLVTEPFWYGTKQTIALQTASTSPAVLALGQIAGDLPTPLFLELRSNTTAADFGDDLYIGAKLVPISTGSFIPIKDFRGTAGGGTFGGQFRRASTSLYNNWQEITEDTSVDLYAVAFGSSAVVFAVGQGGAVYKSTNSGQTWAQKTSNTNNNLRAVIAKSANLVWAAGDAGTIIRSTNGGTSFTVQVSGVSNNLYGLSAASSNVVWAVGSAVTILRSTNAGASYSTQNGVIFYGTYYAVSALSTAKVWIAGYQELTPGGLRYGHVARTLNGGSTWRDFGTNANVAGNNHYNLAISALSTNKTWVTGYKSGTTGRTIWQTQNGGGTWTNESPTGVTQMNSVSMLSTAVGWASGDNGTLYKYNSSDWDQITSPNIPGNLFGVDNYGSSKAVTVGSGFGKYYSANGTDWNQVTNAWALGDVSSYRGSGQLLSRVKTNSTTPASVQMRGSVGWAGGSVSTGTAVNLAASSTWQWVNLGRKYVPATEVSSNISPQPSPIIKLEAKNGSTKATIFDIDVACFLPTDGGAVFIDGAASASQYMTIDSSNNSVGKGANIVSWAGSPPMAQPGDNNIVALESGGIGGFKYQGSYYPRYGQPR